MDRQNSQKSNEEPVKVVSQTAITESLPAKSDDNVNGHSARNQEDDPDAIKDQKSKSKHPSIEDILSQLHKYPPDDELDENDYNDPRKNTHELDDLKNHSITEADKKQPNISEGIQSQSAQRKSDGSISPFSVQTGGESKVKIDLKSNERGNADVSHAEAAGQEELNDYNSRAGKAKSKSNRQSVQKATEPPMIIKQKQNKKGRQQMVLKEALIDGDMLNQQMDLPNTAVRAKLNRNVNAQNDLTHHSREKQASMGMASLTAHHQNQMQINEGIKNQHSSLKSTLKNESSIHTAQEQTAHFKQSADLHSYKDQTMYNKSNGSQGQISHALIQLDTDQTTQDKSMQRMNSEAVVKNNNIKVKKELDVRKMANSDIRNVNQQQIGKSSSQLINISNQSMLLQNQSNAYYQHNQAQSKNQIRVPVHGSQGSPQKKQKSTAQLVLPKIADRSIQSYQPTVSDINSQQLQHQLAHKKFTKHVEKVIKEENIILPEQDLQAELSQSKRHDIENEKAHQIWTSSKKNSDFIGSPRQSNGKDLKMLDKQSPRFKNLGNDMQDSDEQDSAYKLALNFKHARMQDNTINHQDQSQLANKLPFIDNNKRRPEQRAKLGAQNNRKSVKAYIQTEVPFTNDMHDEHIYMNQEQSHKAPDSVIQSSLYLQNDQSGKMTSFSKKSSSTTHLMVDQGTNMTINRPKESSSSTEQAYNYPSFQAKVHVRAQPPAVNNPYSHSKELDPLIVEQVRHHNINNAFNEKFKMMMKHTDDPMEQVNMYLKKKQFVWLNKALNNMERRYKNKRSLLGLEVGATLQGARSVSQMGAAQRFNAASSKDLLRTMREYTDDTEGKKPNNDIQISGKNYEHSLQSFQNVPMVEHSSLAPQQATPKEPNESKSLPAGLQHPYLYSQNLQSYNDSITASDLNQKQPLILNTYNNNSQNSASLDLKSKGALHQLVKDKNTSSIQTLQSKESGLFRSKKDLKQSSSKSSLIMPILNQFKTLRNLPAEQEKSPNIRSLLRLYAENAGYGCGPNDPHRNYTRNEIIALYGLDTRMDSSDEETAEKNGSLSMKNLIQNRMEREYELARKRKHVKKMREIEQTKPHMNEKSKERFLIFKEQIRKELHDNDEYMFSKNYISNNVNPLLRGGKRNSTTTAGHHSAAASALSSSSDEGSVDEALEIEKQETLKKHSTLKKLSVSLGISMGALNATTQQIQEIDREMDYQKKNEEKAVYKISLTDKEKVAEQERKEREKEEIDFVRTIRMIADEQINIMEIIKKRSIDRSNEETKSLAFFLQYKVQFFRNEDFLDKEFMLSVAEKTECKIFKQYDIIMKKGEKGDRMYVSMQGKLGIYLDVKPNLLTDEPIAVLGEYQAVGERALLKKHDKEKRSATVACIDKGDTILLSLEQEDYKKLIYRQIMIAKGKRFQFLVRYLSEIFQKWTKAKILDINENFIDQSSYKANDLVYDIGQPSEVFYIVREGHLILETIIEDEKNMKFPIDAKQWEVQRTTQTILYNIRELKPGDYFGHEEILLEKKSRVTRVRCIKAAQILFINKEDFKENFWDYTLQEMKERHCPLIELESITANIKRFKLIRKKQNIAVLDATQMNPVNLYGDRKVSSVNDSNGMLEQKFERLKPWLRNADANLTHSQKVITETKRIKLLDTRKDKFVVNRSSLITEEQQENFSQLMKPKQRIIAGTYRQHIQMIKEPEADSLMGASRDEDIKRRSSLSKSKSGGRNTGDSFLSKGKQSPHKGSGSRSPTKQNTQAFQSDAELVKMREHLGVYPKQKSQVIDKEYHQIGEEYQKKKSDLYKLYNAIPRGQYDIQSEKAAHGRNTAAAIAKDSWGTDASMKDSSRRGAGRRSGDAARQTPRRGPKPESDNPIQIKDQNVNK